MMFSVSNSLGDLGVGRVKSSFDDFNTTVEAGVFKTRFRGSVAIGKSRCQQIPS
jgi:hypothetical protein